MIFEAQEIIFKYLGELNGTISEAMDNVNAVITNTYFVFGDTRPTPPAIIEVGGCAYKIPKSLPEVRILYITTINKNILFF